MIIAKMSDLIQPNDEIDEIVAQQRTVTRTVIKLKAAWF